MIKKGIIMNLKSKRGKRTILNAGIIGMGMFAIGAGIGAVVSPTQPAIQSANTVASKGVVTTSSKAHRLSSESSKQVSSVSQSSSSSQDASSSVSSSSVSEGSNIENAPAATAESDMPDTAAVKTYTVKAGDSLWSISQELHIDFSVLLAKNPSTDPNHIEAGEVINIR